MDVRGAIARGRRKWDPFWAGFIAVEAVLLGLGALLLLSAHAATIDERTGTLSSVDQDWSRVFGRSETICLTRPCAERYRVYHEEFDPPLPDLFAIRGSTIGVLAVEGTGDVMALRLGDTLHATFTYRHPEARAWWMRLWGLVFISWAFIPFLLWLSADRGHTDDGRTKRVGRRSRGEGMYLVSFISALLILIEFWRLQSLPPAGAGQLVNAFVPVALLAWWWPVAIGASLGTLATRRMAGSPLGRHAEAVASILALFTAVLLFVAAFELAIYWDAVTPATR